LKSLISNGSSSGDGAGSANGSIRRGPKNGTSSPKSRLSPGEKPGTGLGMPVPPRRSASGTAKDTNADGGSDQHPARLEETTPRPEVGVMMVVVWQSNYPDLWMLLRRRMEGLRSKQCSPRGLTTHDLPFLCGVCHSARPPFMEHVQSAVSSPYDTTIALLAACSEGALKGSED
jgi:hypothetical protein